MFPYKSLERNFAKELLRTITVTVPLVHPDYWPLLLSQEKLKNPKFSQQKVAVFTKSRTNKQLWQKSRFRFDSKNTTFCEHHKYKQWIPNWLLLWPYEKHLSGVVSNLKPVPQYCFMITSCTHLIISPFTQQNENENCLWASSKRKLKQTNLKFSNVQNH